MSLRKALRKVYRPSNEFLQQIDDLEKSSPDFPRRLARLLRETEIELIRVLERKDQEWLAEYLDNTCSTLHPIDPAYRKCMDGLGWACFFARKLPQSQILDVSSLVPIPDPTPIGPYEICYEGLSNGSRVCVKKLKSSLAREWNSHVAQRFFDFVVKWKYLAHSNIVPFLGITNKPTRFVSAWVPGISLTDYIINHPDAANPLDLLISIARGLEYLHSRGVVHGDFGGVRNCLKAFTTM